MSKQELVVRSDLLFTSDPTGPLLLDGHFVVRGETISRLAAGEAPSSLRDTATYIDARGSLVLPGFIDPHTHLVHGGSRANELPLKLQGKSYMELHETGGILSTVEQTRRASKAELKDKARKTLAFMLSCGVTTVEAKSGYGLDLETERKCLEAARELGAEQAVEIVSTFMGAHAVPREFSGRTEAYIDYLIEVCLPALKELAEFADVFCEEGVFSVAQSRRYLQAAKQLGYKLKVHADEIVSLGGAELAAELGAVSAEHLMAVSETGIQAMAARKVVACLLPATTFYLMAPHYAPARRFLEAGVPLALSTDYNPGSSPIANLQLAMQLALFNMRLLPEEVLLAVTREAARALDRPTLGQLRVGFQADFLLTDAVSPADFFYRPGQNRVRTVFKKGKLVFAGETLKHQNTTEMRLIE